MGSRAPSIHQIGVSGVGMDDDKKQIESVDFNLSVDYSGGLGIAIDVALAYGKSAFLSAKGIQCPSFDDVSGKTYLAVSSTRSSTRSPI